MWCDVMHRNALVSMPKTKELFTYIQITKVEFKRGIFHIFLQNKMKQQKYIRFENLKLQRKKKPRSLPVFIYHRKITVSTYTRSKSINFSIFVLLAFFKFCIENWENNFFLLYFKFVSHCFLPNPRNLDRGYTRCNVMRCVNRFLCFIFVAIHLAHRVHTFTPFASLRTTKLWWSK